MAKLPSAKLPAASPPRVALRRRFLTQWRVTGMVIGSAVGLFLVGFLVYPDRSALVAKGPMNTGHEELACQDCHLAVEGTAAQQFSANVHYWLGLRASTIGFGSRDVDNAACLDCHERPEDRHPVSRFLEPRFADQRQALAPHECASCHNEHRGVRITQATIGYCSHCHQDTSLEEDPITPTHEALVRQAGWNTCLRCHDFHGNYVWSTPVNLEEALPESRVWDYFSGGPSPYGEVKYVESSPGRGKTE